ncbi:hypothetical protein NXS19_002570 [Fusarium pseudograminearum]|nr:hypothetical protein NXS19_002570 [Fusarium pseudograminearum]
MSEWSGFYYASANPLPTFARKAKAEKEWHRPETPHGPFQLPTTSNPTQDVPFGIREPLVAASVAAVARRTSRLSCIPAPAPSPKAAPPWRKTILITRTPKSYHLTRADNLQHRRQPHISLVSTQRLPLAQRHLYLPLLSSIAPSLSINLENASSFPVTQERLLLPTALLI